MVISHKIEHDEIEDIVTDDEKIDDGYKDETYAYWREHKYP